MGKKFRTALASVRTVTLGGEPQHILIQGEKSTYTDELVRDFASIDFFASAPRLELPVTFLHGRHDGNRASCSGPAGGFEIRGKALNAAVNARVECLFAAMGLTRLRGKTTALKKRIKMPSHFASLNRLKGITMEKAG